MLAWLPLVVGALALLRRFPLPAAGILWTFGALLPVLHLFPIGVLMAERLTYLPSAGFCIAVAAVIGSVRRTPLVVAAVLALVAVLGIRSTVRAADWRSDLALWESEIDKAPRDVVVNNNLAVAYSARGEYAKAIPPLETAIRVAPGYWRARVNLGIAEQGLGRPERARAAYLEAIRIAPREVDPLYFYARFQADQGDHAGAVATLDAARRRAPGAGSPGDRPGPRLPQAGARRRRSGGVPGGAGHRPGGRGSEGGARGARRTGAVGGRRLARDRVPREQVHVNVAVGLARRLEVVDAAEDPAVLQRGGAALPSRHHVVHLQAHLRSTDATGGELPLALPSVPLHDLPLHLRRHGGPPLLLLREEQFQRRGEHLLVGRAGLHVALPRPGLLQKARNAGETVTCIRVSSEVSGSTTVRGAGATGSLHLAFRTSSPD